MAADSNLEEENSEELDAADFSDDGDRYESSFSFIPSKCTSKFADHSTTRVPMEMKECRNPSRTRRSFTTSIPVRVLQLNPHTHYISHLLFVHLILNSCTNFAFSAQSRGNNASASSSYISRSALKSPPSHLTFTRTRTFPAIYHILLSCNFSIFISYYSSWTSYMMINEWIFLNFRWKAIRAVPNWSDNSSAKWGVQQRGQRRRGACRAWTDSTQRPLEAWMGPRSAGRHEQGRSPSVQGREERYLAHQTDPFRHVSKPIRWFFFSIEFSC